MTHSIKADAHAVLLPAFADTHLSDAVKHLLSNGGCSILLGETREEYVAREMSLKRRKEEKSEDIIAVTEEAKSLSGDLIVAIDQEVSGICRLHDLVPSFPPREEIVRIGNREFGNVCSDISVAAKDLGINCFLGPILDVVTGGNPWLAGRTWSKDPVVIAEKSNVYIRAIQSQGIAAAAKHFPGYSTIELDPAVEPEARNLESAESFKVTLFPFKDAIKSEVEIVMTGPAIVETFDSGKAASISPSIIGMLRDKLGFNGVVMSDDLDSQAILRGQSITEVAVEALKAGSDYLLLADIDDHLNLVIAAIVKAVETGDLSKNRLGDAAERVRSLAARYSRTC